MKIPVTLATGLLLAAGCSSTPRTEVRTPFEMGRDAALAGDYDTAIAQLTLAVENSQESFFAAAYLERGECYVNVALAPQREAAKDENLTRALKDFDLVLGQDEIDPADEARALSAKGRILVERGDVQEAEKCFAGILGLELQPSDKHYLLRAYSHLGWMFLERARLQVKASPTAEEEIATQEAFRRAQEAFSLGLQIDGSDQDCNLGKGICLHFRGQDGEAAGFLEKSIATSAAADKANPLGHYYLARSLELQGGFQLDALGHYRKAVEQDTGRSFTPLYAQLVKALPVYLSFADSEFRWFLDRMLSYKGPDSEYWASLESLAERLISSGGDARQAVKPNGAASSKVMELGLLTRALARARSLKVKESVEDALLLCDTPDFIRHLATIFPREPDRPEYLYGKALTLLGARRFEELDAFFQEDISSLLAPAARESDYYHKTMVLQGSSILQKWVAENEASPGTATPEAKIQREKTLGKARDAFQTYLERYPKDREIRMALGQVQEILESYAAAYSNYAMVALQAEDNTAALRRVKNLHEKRLLPEQDFAAAWSILRDYKGSDSEIISYIRQRQTAILSEALLYCRGCGRKGAEGDTQCLECAVSSTAGPRQLLKKNVRPEMGEIQWGNFGPELKLTSRRIPAGSPRSGLDRPNRKITFSLFAYIFYY